MSYMGDMNCLHIIIHLVPNESALTSASIGPATTCSSNICRAGRLFTGFSAGRSGW
jgi:hypothetical protein